MATTKATETTIEIAPIEVGSGTFAILGTTPFIANRLAEKAKRELLLPTGRKTTAQRSASLKHVPIDEYRNSPYVLREAAPTRLAVLAQMFKAALSTAALDSQGARKAQIERLVHPVGNRLPLYGKPELLMSVTRSADMAKTPDIRTRAIVPEWVCFVTLQWVAPIVHERTVVNLLTAAGFSIGVGDWRPQKGSGTFGQFRIAEPDDPEIIRIMTTGGRAAQDAALENPTFYDDESAELFNWYTEEVATRYSANDVRRMATVASADDDEDADVFDMVGANGVEA